MTHRLPGATSRFRAVEAHHPQGGGMALKSADRGAFPMCGRHHVDEFHSLKGTFKTWDKAKRKAWEREMTAYYQALHEVKGAA
jgi:hypothetical protein